jgi:hypothetical protein
MSSKYWVFATVSTLVASTIVAFAQVGPSPHSTQPTGIPGFNVWTIKTKNCVNIGACPTQTNLPISWGDGDPCTYCALGLMQKSCSGKVDRACTETLYRVLASPPSCGVFWSGGTVDGNGNYAGAVPSATQIGYRLNCEDGIPEGTP